MPSVSYDTLQKLVNAGATSPYLSARMEYKEVSTLLQQHILRMEGHRRVYPNMCSPQASGRVGLSDPPLGNFTNDQTYGPHGLRDVVRPDKGWKWVCPDWNAVEGWIVSHRSKDLPDLEVKRRGLDLHTVTAIRALKYPDPPFEPTKANLKNEQGQEWCLSQGYDELIRLGMKNVRFTMHYAKNIKAVRKYAIKLGMDPNLLEEFAHAYMRSKPWLTRFKEARWTNAVEKREARTAFGRRRRLFGDDYRIAKEGLNHEVQGTVADLMKMTQVSLAEIGCQMVLQRHDGWYSDVPAEWGTCLLHPYPDLECAEKGITRPAKMETLMNSIDMLTYKAIVEKEWIIDERPITFEAEYDIWS